MTQGNKADAEIRRRAEIIAGKLDEVAELQAELKKLKEEAKADGFDMKAFGQIVKEMRKGTDYQVAQLELELVLDTYRGAVGLPTDLVEAQRLAAAAAAEVPEPAEKKRRAKELN